MRSGLAAGLVCIAVTMVVTAQDAQPPALLYGAFEKGGPIVTGTITAVQSPTELTLLVATQLRGDYHCADAAHRLLHAAESKAAAHAVGASGA